MRIVPSTLVFLASVSFTVAIVAGALDASAKHIVSPAKSEVKQVESKSGDGKSDAKADVKPDGDAKVFTYKQTGGFIGVNRKYEKNLADLPGDERQKLEKLIADSGLLNDSKKNEFTGGACDMFQYDFTFKDGAKQHHMVYDDGTLPKSFRPLIAYCKDKMVDQRHH